MKVNRMKRETAVSIKSRRFQFTNVTKSIWKFRFIHVSDTRFETHTNSLKQIHCFIDVTKRSWRVCEMVCSIRGSAEFRFSFPFFKLFLRRVIQSMPEFFFPSTVVGFQTNVKKIFKYSMEPSLCCAISFWRIFQILH